MKFLALDPTDWIAISSVVIAACALATSIWQGVIARKHARLSAKPIVEATVNGRSAAGIEIKNSGLGPALLKHVSANYQSVSYNLSRSSEIKALIDALIPDPSIRLNINTVIPGPDSTLAAGESIHILSAKTDDWPQMTSMLARSFAQLELALVYEDIYGKSFSCTHRFGSNA